MARNDLSSSVRKSGCAIEISAAPRSRRVIPCRFTAPYSVMTQCTCPRVVTTPAPGFSSGTIRDIFPPEAVERKARIGFPRAEKRRAVDEIHLPADPRVDAVPDRVGAHSAPSGPPEDRS